MADKKFKRLLDLSRRLWKETETRVYLNNFDGAYNILIIEPGVGRDKEKEYAIKKEAESEADAKNQYRDAIRHMQGLLKEETE